MSKPNKYNKNTKYNKNKSKKNNHKSNKTAEFVLDNRSPLNQFLINSDPNTFRKIRFNELPIEQQISIKRRQESARWSGSYKPFDPDSFSKQQEQLRKISSQYQSESNEDPLFSLAKMIMNKPQGVPVIRDPFTGQIIPREIINDGFLDDISFKTFDMSSIDDILQSKMAELNMVIDSLDDDDDEVIIDGNGMYDNDYPCVSSDELRETLLSQGLIGDVDSIDNYDPRDDFNNNMSFESMYQETGLYQDNSLNRYHTDPDRYDPEYYPYETTSYQNVFGDQYDNNNDGPDKSFIMNKQDDIIE